MIGPADAYEPCESGCGMHVTYDLRSINGKDYAAFWERPYFGEPGELYTIIHTPERCRAARRARD